jgi:hypothetical protein
MAEAAETSPVPEGSEEVAAPSLPPDASSDATENDCPARPSSTELSELGFVRRPMVRWLDPHQLVDTAARVVLSGIFGSYADSRELQALVESEVLDRSAPSELWLDYVADLGDGWNPTYTVARLLAAETLELESDGQTLATERGRILVMGGDAAYPVPTRDEYENRMLGPYRAALPCAHGENPELLVVPGSHDWYDGLHNFTSVFCRGRWIGGWKTRQRRSYFAVKLPHRWWLWGIDIQFGAYLDEAQLRYFHEVASEQVEPGDRIILCLAKEVASGRSNAETYSDRNLEYIERQVIEPTGARVVLYLQSGRHHYCRYEEEGGARHHVTSGGGGAFLHPTHQLPDHRELPGQDAATRRLRRVATYPSATVSRRLRKRVWLLPIYNLPLAAVFGVVQVLLAFMMGLHLEDAHRSLGLGDLGMMVWASPTAFLLILLMVLTLGAMVRLAHEASGLVRVVLGVVHSALQLASVAAVMVASSRLSSSLDLGVPSVVVFLGFAALLGGLGGTLGIAGYLWVTNCLGFHGNETYAPLHHADLKHFVRLRIGEDGNLTLYPVGIDRVGQRWRLCPDAAPEAPWFESEDGALEPHLIEGPVRITGG